MRIQLYCIAFGKHAPEKYSDAVRAMRRFTIAARDVQVLEAGEIYFAYRRAMRDGFGGEPEAAQLYLVLASAAEERYRIIDLQSPRMPGRGSIYKSVVLRVSNDGEDIESALIGDGPDAVYASLALAATGEYTLCQYGSLLVLIHTLYDPEDTATLTGQLMIPTRAAYLVTGTNADFRSSAPARLLDSAGAVLSLAPAPLWVAETVLPKASDDSIQS